ncbi:hypothetical protein JCM10908_005385 [Rhodotorula pacifica]|uniref:serine/threonine-protein kinase n=1 Tax=Rhodotorula pacifica TaxID=1495444 RepID=UPI003182700E
MAAPSRPSLERNAATGLPLLGPASTSNTHSPSPPSTSKDHRGLTSSPSLSRSVRTDSLAAIATSLDSPRLARPPLRSTATSPPTSPVSAGLTSSASSAAAAATTSSSSLGLGLGGSSSRAPAPPRLSAASLTSVAVSKQHHHALSRESTVSSGTGSVQSRSSLRASPASSSSTTTTVGTGQGHGAPRGGATPATAAAGMADGFLVTSRPKHYVPPSVTSPASPGPSTALMGANPFYGRSSPAGSRNTSRQNSRESSRERAAAVKREKREVDKLIRHYAGLGKGGTGGPDRERGRSTDSLGSAGVGGEGGLGRRGSSPAVLPTESRLADEPKTTRTLSSTIDSKGRRMVNQYVRLKTIGQGSHGKVWLCAEPSVALTDEPEEYEEDGAGGDDEQGAALDRTGSSRSTKGKRRRTPSQKWEDDIDAGKVQYCAIKSVAREGPRGARGQRSLRMAAQQRNKRPSTTSQGSGGIGADDKVKREVAIMKRLDHPNIVRLKEVIDDAKSKKVFMVLEFMAGGQVVWQDDNKQPTMTVDDARRTFRDVVLGLEYLHYQGIIHRDIKPANLLWTEDHSTVKISDFGVSHVSDALLRASPDSDPACEGDDEKALRKTAGSPAFFAPELCFPAEWSTTPGGTSSHHRDSMASTTSSLPPTASDAYFPLGMEGSAVTPPGGASHSSTPAPPRTTANGLPLSDVTISTPIAHLSSSKPRTRPPVGKGIDIWALGVTLYCLLFGDTPFMARTEYELYNVIVREPIRVPLVMGRERAWTGVGQPWEGAGDGAEGREAIDLLGRLLEKDPLRRITLEEVKQHPWVLRNLASPASWLRATDPARTNHVTITDEDVQHATQERGAVDTLPPIRNRPGIRRALNAALAKFPAFSRIKSTRTTASTNSEETPQANERDPRTRSKSSSSAAHSIDPTADSSVSSVSRHPSDAGGAPIKGNRSSKFSHEGGLPPTGGNSFGSELRRIISGGHSFSNDAAAAGGSSPGPLGRGGWGSGRRKLTPTNTLEPHSPPNASTLFPELARSTSTSSVLQSGSGRSSFGHAWFQRRPSDSDTSGIKSPVSSLPSPGPVHKSSLSPSPYPGSDTETSHVNGKGSGTLSRMLSRIAHGHGSGHGSGTTSTTGSLHSRSSVRERDDRLGAGGDSHVRASSGNLTADGIDPAIVEQFEAAGTTRAQYDSLGRLISARKVSGESGASLQYASRLRNEGDHGDHDDDDDEGAMIDLTEFEYSDTDDDEDDEDDDLDDLQSPPLGEANYLSGWQPASFGDFRIGIRSPSGDFNALHALGNEGSPLATPPTDEVGPLEAEEEDGKIGPTSTASAAAASRPSVTTVQPVQEYVPFADAVSYSLCPIDFDEDAWRIPPATQTESAAPQLPPHIVETVASRRDRAPMSIATGLTPPGRERYDSTQGSQASQSPRDGSIRGISLDTPSETGKTTHHQWDDAESGDCEDEEEEMLVVPRRRRAATLSGSGQATPQR